MSREGRSSRNRVSILSWMWTIVLACIPGVNIIAMFLLAFLSRKQPKRSFAVASLILMLIVAILIFEPSWSSPRSCSPLVNGCATGRPCRARARRWGCKSEHGKRSRHRDGSFFARYCASPSSHATDTPRASAMTGSS